MSVPFDGRLTSEADAAEPQVHGGIAATLVGTAGAVAHGWAVATAALAPDHRARVVFEADA